MTMKLTIVMAIRRNSFRYPVTAAFRSVSRPFSQNWLRTGSHQTPIGIKHAVM